MNSIQVDHCDFGSQIDWTPNANAWLKRKVVSAGHDDFATRNQQIPDSLYGSEAHCAWLIQGNQEMLCPCPGLDVSSQ
jgi:hypothetical protein